MSTAVSKTELPITAEEVESLAAAGNMTPGIAARIEAWASIGGFIAANRPFHSQLAELAHDRERADRIIGYCEKLMEEDRLPNEDRLAAMKCAAAILDAKRKVHQHTTSVLVQMGQLQIAAESKAPQNTPPPMKIAVATKT